MLTASDSLCGMMISPPFMHDGRCSTLEDTVKFLNRAFALRLTEEETSMVAFLGVL